MSKPSQANIDAWNDAARLPARRDATECAFADLPKRALGEGEIESLVAQGNSAEDWSHVRVVEDFETMRVMGNRFEGRVELGRFSVELAEDGEPRAGLYHSTIRDCVIAGQARVARCAWVNRCFVGPGARIEGVGRIEATDEASFFGNDLVLFDGDYYNRRLRAVAEAPFDWLAWASSPEAASGVENDELRAAIEAAFNQYAERMRADRVFIGSGARVIATPLIENAWIGSGATIEAAAAIRNATIWATEEEPTIIRDGARVARSLIGPGCRVENLATIENALLSEHIEVGCQGIVKRSAVGADGRLGESEVNNCLLGPMTTAIHHGLIISAWWPEGRGNLAYGANVGSNHTGRAPDQEIFPGEGLFFGLGCNIKFPANYREAPYTIIATGTDTLPQRVSFPFSLIAPPASAPEGLSPAINEICPAWGLAHNAYGIERQDVGQRSRIRGRRAAAAPSLFRRDLIEAMISARDRLESIGKSVRDFYTETDLTGLGKNFMTESARREAIDAYAFGIEVGAARTALGALKNVETHGPEALADKFIKDVIARSASLLKADDAQNLLARIFAALERWGEAIHLTRAKDERRGVAILDDYAERHVSTAEDPLVKDFDSRLDEARSRIADYRAALERSPALFASAKGLAADQS